MKAVLFAALLMWGDGHEGAHLTIDDMPERPVWVHPVIPIHGRRATQEGHWMTTPDILICHNGPVTTSRVERALRYWERLGYVFGTITHGLPGNMDCNTGVATYQTITIDIPSQGFKFGVHLGSTKAWRYRTNDEIFKARIEIIPAWGATERILEHEIGHALGWRDMNYTGHIMNSVWASGGFNSKGVENGTE
jgi:hypothetical protein